MRFKFGVGQDAKPNDMAIQVMIAPASNKGQLFCRIFGTTLNIALILRYCQMAVS